MAASSSTRQKRTKRSNQLTTLLLVLPLLLFYEIGVLFSDVMNGADFITQTFLHLAGVKGFLVIQAGVLVLCLVLALYLRRSQKFEIRHFIPVLLESGIYALTMGTFIIFVMTDLLGINPALGGVLKEAGLFDGLVLSVGAGVYEELVFRLIILGGLHLIGLRLLKLRSWISLCLAFLISSVLFSIAHHIGPLGEPFRIGVFTYRFIAGLFFGALFQFRGFAIAVYTHALYDIYVLLLH